jgi:tetratricopeptide (TPR) repeat protein
MANRRAQTFPIILLSALLLTLSACAAKPEDAETRINQGDQSFEAKEYDQAVKNYTAAIEAKPEATVYQKRAKAYAAEGKHQEAINDFHQVLDRDQNSAEAWTGLGISSTETKDYSVAEAAFRKALQLDPNYAEAYYWRARMSQAQGEKENAIADFKRFAEKSSDPKLKEAAQLALKELEAR